MECQPVRLGVIGCGRFARFALEHFSRTPGVELVAAADEDPRAAGELARRFGLSALSGPEALAGSPDVELVYVATPPFLHHRHGMLCLEAGKHVICEKPLALTLGQADEMIAAARRGGLLLVADMMQRYNPLFDAVRRVIEEKLLGEPLHGYFENYAKDEELPPQHWFWDRSKSGGIFVEHGVHFFDLFAGWFGEGSVEAAQRSLRPGTSLEEQVQCTVRYGEGVLVNFYHGFHQPARLDRQEMRLVFERGDVTLRGWIPTVVEVHAVATEDHAQRLREVFPGAALQTTVSYGGEERFCLGRSRALEVDGMIELRAGRAEDKMERYGELLRALLADQVAWVRDAGHRRRVTAEHARAAAGPDGGAA